jgi:hypothetical protein
MRWLGFVWSALAIAAVSAQAHGVHMSTATVDYRSATKSLEIVITLSAQHLEEILSSQSGKRLELDRSPGIEDLAKDYLFRRFSVQNESKKFITLYWVGMEIKGGNVNLYVEAKVPGDGGLALRNELLLDWQKDQINRVLPKRDGQGKPPQLLYWSGNAGQHLPLAF